MPEPEIQEKNSPINYDEIINEPNRIRSLLQLCLLHQEKVELQIGEQVRIYFSRMAPPPISDGTTAAEGRPPVETEQKPANPASGPGTPVNPKDNIFLIPMEPPIGNVQLRKHPDIPLTLRFFNRMQTIEGKILFQGTCQGGEGTLLRFSLPVELGSYRQRRHYRVQVIPDYPAKLTVQLPGKKIVTPRLQDISFGGISCIFPGPTDLPSLGAKLNLSLEIPDTAKLDLVGYVRNHEPVPHQPGSTLPANSIRVGMQLDQVNRSQEDRLNNIVARIQQAFLANLRQKEAQSPQNAADEKKPSELSKLMVLKKKKKSSIIG
ncbi:MAG: PilZ domain-containing protein [Magnetococcus sp. DMHC-1]|nr:PilZ domain-containing protein [Magnetococcales bacterium]